jgi:CRP/FNR family transcriptional regulator, cyclic AMP receptor protein
VKSRCAREDDLTRRKRTGGEKRYSIVTRFAPVGRRSWRTPMPGKGKIPMFDPKPFLADIDVGATILTPDEDQIIFTQRDPSDAIFYIKNGKVKVTVVSHKGKEAVLTIMGSGEFFGEGCLTGQLRRTATVSTITNCTLVRLEKAAVVRMLRDNAQFSAMFMLFLLQRNARVEADLVDQLVNSSEKRLARILLTMANFGKEGRPDPVIPISQKTLAQMVGTTRERVSAFMNKFRRLGFVKYNRHRLEIHGSLLTFISTTDG